MKGATQVATPPWPWPLAAARQHQTAAVAVVVVTRMATWMDAPVALAAVVVLILLIEGSLAAAPGRRETAEAEGLPVRALVVAVVTPALAPMLWRQAAVAAATAAVAMTWRCSLEAQVLILRLGRRAVVTARTAHQAVLRCRQPMPTLQTTEAAAGGPVAVRLVQAVVVMAAAAGSCCATWG